MKKALLLVVLLAAGAGYCLFTEGNISDREVSGIRVRSETWSGTITITSDVVMAPWATLTVAPGTRVQFTKKPYVEGTGWTSFADSYITEHDDPTGKIGYGQSHFFLSGKIIARGTDDAPIVFTSAQDNPEYADWDELVLRSGSVLDRVSVAYAHNGVNIQGDGVVVRNSTIHDSLWSCIDIFSTGNTIENNDVYHCWHQAVGVKVTGQNAITGNYLHDSQLSVNCEHGADPIINRNTIHAAPLNPDCPVSEDNTEEVAVPDTAGGTFGGKLIYPSAR